MHLKIIPTARGNLVVSEDNFSDLHCLKQAFTCIAAYFLLSLCIPSGIHIMKDQVEGASLTETDFFLLNLGYMLLVVAENYHLIWKTTIYYYAN